MIMSGIVRLGKDAEVRFLNDGTAVANLAVVFNYGAKQDDGNRPSQWVDAAFFGKRAESLSPYLLKGSQIGITLEAPHIEVFQKQDGTQSTKLAARVVDIELISGQGGNQSQATQSPTQQPTQQQRPQQRPAASNSTPARSSLDDFDDFIPF